MLTQRSLDTVLNILAPLSAAATVNATSAWIDVRGYEGDVTVLAHTGVVTAGSITWTFQTATDNTGTGARTITPSEGALTAVTTANDDPNLQKATFEARNLDGFLRVTGTIATGPAVVSLSLVGRKKYTS